MRGVGQIDLLPRRVGLGQRQGDVVDMAQRVGKILPGVRVAMALSSSMAMLVLVVLQLERLDPGAGAYDTAAVARRLDQAVDPALETEAVDDHQIGLGDGLASAGVGGKAWASLSGPTSVSRLDAIAADFARQIAEDAEAGDDFGRLRCRCSCRDGGRPGRATGAGFSL